METNIIELSRSEMENHVKNRKDWAEEFNLKQFIIDDKYKIGVSSISVHEDKDETKDVAFIGLLWTYNTSKNKFTKLQLFDNILPDEIENFGKTIIEMVIAIARFYEVPKIVVEKGTSPLPLANVFEKFDFKEKETNKLTLELTY